VAPAPSGYPDWRDDAAYAGLLNVERAAFAWEWLRRGAAYRQAATEAISARRGSEVRCEESAAAHWGLHAFEDPGIAAPKARPVWRAERHELVLAATAEQSASGADALDLEPLLGRVTRIEGAGARHLLISDGRRSIRLDLEGADPLLGPVRLHYRLNGLEAAQGPLLALRRLLALARGGDFSPALHPPEARAARLVAMLRTHDALEAGATQREIASLLSGDAAGERWRVRAPSVRSQVQRLVRGAASMSGRNCLSLLSRPAVSRRP
jgi:hypothetical protein